MNKESGERHWCDFIKEEIARGKEVTLQIATGSMRPLIRPKDSVIVKGGKVSGLQSGDIILFERNTRLYVHRLLIKQYHNGEVILLSKGDNTLVMDKSISAEQFLGKVVKVKRNQKVINLAKPPWSIINRFLYIFARLQIKALGIYRGWKGCFLKSREVTYRKI